MKKMSGFNHFKIDILESLMWRFNPFTLDGVKPLYVKVHEKTKKEREVSLERYIFEKCSQPFFGILGI